MPEWPDISDEEKEMLAKIPPSEYYNRLMRMLDALNVSDGATMPPIGFMIERMLANDIPIEKILDERAAHKKMPLCHRKKMQEALAWKKQQLKARQVVFHNVN